MTGKDLYPAETGLDEEKVIELSRKKSALILLVSVVFVVLGIFFLLLSLLEPDTVASSTSRYDSPAVLGAIGAASIVVFSIAGIVSVKKLLDRRPGVILSSRGIKDNSSGLSAGFIPWSEITGVDEYKLTKQKFVSIYLKDPEKYLRKGNWLQRLLNRGNLAMAGTPINISANTLKIKHEELLSSVKQYFRNSRGSA